MSMILIQYTFRKSCCPPRSIQFKHACPPRLRPLTARNFNPEGSLRSKMKIEKMDFLVKFFKSGVIFKGGLHEKSRSGKNRQDRKFRPKKCFQVDLCTSQPFLGTPHFLKNFLHQGYYLVVFRDFSYFSAKFKNVFFRVSGFISIFKI